MVKKWISRNYRMLCVLGRVFAAASLPALLLAPGSVRDGLSALLMGLGALCGGLSSAAADGSILSDRDMEYMTKSRERKYLWYCRLLARTGAAALLAGAVLALFSQRWPAMAMLIVYGLSLPAGYILNANFSK